MRTRLLALALFIACIPLANWAVDRYGFVSVGFGLMAPAGVYFAGLSFTARDVVHEQWGRLPVILAIIGGAALSWLVAPSFAVASGVAFLFSESADLAVYEPLRKRQWTVAVVASGIVGAVVDSFLFLHLADLPSDGKSVAGLVVGKLFMVALAALLLTPVRKRILAPA